MYRIAEYRYESVRIGISIESKIPVYDTYRKPVRSPIIGTRKKTPKLLLPAPPAGDKRRTVWWQIGQILYVKHIKYECISLRRWKLI